MDDLIEQEGETIRKLDDFAQRLYSAIIERHQEKTYRLADCCNFIPGYSYSGSELQDSDIGMVSIKSFERTGGFKLDGVKPLLPSKSIATKKCEIGDVLVAHTDLTKNQEIIGSPVLATTKGNFKELTFSMDLVKVVSKVEWLNNAILYRVLNSSSFKKHALGFCTGTTVVHLSKKALETYTFEGPLSIDESIANKLIDIQNAIAYKTKIIEMLESAKATLLTKYFGSN